MPEPIDRLQQEIITSEDFNSKSEVRQAFFHALEVNHPAAWPSTTDRARAVGLGNRASELLFKGDFKPNEIFVMDQNASKAMVERMGEQQYRLQMGRYKEACQLLIKEVVEPNQKVADRMIAEGVAAKNELFGQDIKKIIFV